MKFDHFKQKTAKQIGDYGERKAAWYLLRHGYWIQSRNYRCGKCEIDLIAVSLRKILFVEVKTRTYREEDLEFALPPSAAVDDRKVRCTRAAAKRYLLEHPTNREPRMDVIEVWMVNGKAFRIRHLPDFY